MIVISGATLKEKRIIKKVEKACFAHLKQDNFFVTDIAIVDEDTIHQLNNSARGVDRVTDVLSFPCFEKMQLPVKMGDFCEYDFVKGKVELGSIMICRKRAQEQAQEYGHSYEREIGFLACHGFLHILGFDHIEPQDEEVMTSHQKAIMDIVKLYR